jgi:hypothetical protein
MIYELFGLPASGKTYCAGQIAEQNRAEVVLVSSRLHRYIMCSKFIVSRPSVSALLLTTLLRETGLKPKLIFYKLRILVGCLAKEQTARVNDRGVVDMGLVQFLLTIYERPIEQVDLERLVRLFDRTKYMIYVFEVDPAIRAERLAARGGGLRKGFSEEYAANWLALTEANFKVVRDFLHERFDCMTFRN